MTNLPVCLFTFVHFSTHLTLLYSTVIFSPHTLLCILLYYSLLLFSLFLYSLLYSTLHFTSFHYCLFI